MIKPIKAYAVIDRQKLKLNAMEIYRAKDDVVLGKNEIGILVYIKAVEDQKSQKPVLKSKTRVLKKSPQRSKH